MSDDPAVDLARECVYRFLSAALTDPSSPGWRRVLDPENQALAVEAGRVLREALAGEPMDLTFGELGAEELDLEPLVSELNESPERLLGDYERVFGLVVPRECPPYEVEYHPPAQTFLRSQEMADIAGFYRAFGLTTSSQHPERPDHIVLELEFMAVLLAKLRIAAEGADNHSEAAERVTACFEAQRSFFRDHMCWWAPAFAAGLRRKAGAGYLREVGRVLAATVPAERRRLDVAPPLARTPRPGLIERPEEETGCEVCPMLDAAAGPESPVPCFQP